VCVSASFSLFPPRSLFLPRFLMPFQAVFLLILVEKPSRRMTPFCSPKPLPFVCLVDFHANPPLVETPAPFSLPYPPLLLFPRSFGSYVFQFHTCFLVLICLVGMNPPLSFSLFSPPCELPPCSSPVPQFPFFVDLCSEKTIH